MRSLCRIISDAAGGRPRWLPDRAHLLAGAVQSFLGWGLKPAVKYLSSPGFQSLLCHWRGLGCFRELQGTSGFRVSVVEPSAKTLGFGVLGITVYDERLNPEQSNRQPRVI